MNKHCSFRKYIPKLCKEMGNALPSLVYSISCRQQSRGAASYRFLPLTQLNIVTDVKILRCLTSSTHVVETPSRQAGDSNPSLRSALPVRTQLHHCGGKCVKNTFQPSELSKNSQAFEEVTALAFY